MDQFLKCFISVSVKKIIIYLGDQLVCGFAKQYVSKYSAYFKALKYENHLQLTPQE